MPGPSRGVHLALGLGLSDLLVQALRPGGAAASLSATVGLDSGPVCVYIYTHIYMYVYVCIYIYIYVCVYVSG